MMVFNKGFLLLTDRFYATLSYESYPPARGSTIVCNLQAWSNLSDDLRNFLTNYGFN
jgi:hypothetical protein